MTIPEKCICDFCKKENPLHKGVKLPIIVIPAESEEEGGEFYHYPYMEFIPVDICEECLYKVTNIHAISFAGVKINMTITTEQKS